MKKLGLVILLGMVVLTFFVSAQVRAAEVKEYKIPAIADFSGPYADVMKTWNANRIAAVNWWSDTVGKEMGIKLTPKAYDTRYDATVTASMWPGILSECQPILALGMGGTDVAALQQRLPKDQVPVVYGTGAYGYGWLPDLWLFHARPTYVHEFMAALLWYINQHPEKKPIKFAIITFQGSPATLDAVKGMENYFKTVLEPKGLAKIVATEWTEIQPVDVSSQMKRIIDAKADIMLGGGTTAIAAAVIRAQQLYGVSIPTIAAPHHTIWPLGQAMKSFKDWEGHLVVAGHASITATDSKAYEYHKVLQKSFGLKADDWNPIGMMGLTQGILAVRAIEHAAKKVGGANLTGKAVYEALSTGTFTEDELMGVLPTLQFTKEAPFPTKDMKVTIETVKGGKYQQATPGWVPAPADLTKW